MKKIYNKPEMETLVIKSSKQLLAGSYVPTNPEPANPSTSDAPAYDFEF